MELPKFLAEQMPFESRFIEIDGHQMHYIDEGSGPVVMLLHGNPTWSFYYRNLIDVLRGKFRVIAPDFIGCGLSDHPTNRHFRADHRIGHLEEFLDKLEIDQFSLVMHDWGGSIGTATALRRLEQVQRLVYLNTTLTETESLPKLIKTAAHPLLGKFLTKFSARFLKFTTTLGVGKKLSKQVKKGYYYPYRTRADRTAIWDFVADIPFNDAHPSYALMLQLAEDIPKLSDKPVQIIWGLRDPCFHREMLSKVAQHFPQASVLEIPEASHLVLEDAPDLVNSTIRTFLNGDGGSDNLTTTHEPDGLRNALYENFVKHVQERPDSLAAIVPSFFGDSVKYAQSSYRDLEVSVNKYQRGLSQLGLRSGDKVLMLVAPGLDFLALSLAVMGRGGIPIFLDSGMGLRKLLSCIEEIEPDIFIGSPKARVLPILKKKIFKSVKLSVTASEWVSLGGFNLSFLKKFISKPLTDPAYTNTCMIAFTSGATGVPKGVVYTNTMVRSQLEIFENTFGLEAGKRDFPLLPIFALFNAGLGVTSVFPPINPTRPLAMDPQRVVRVMKDQAVSYSFGSPTLWRKIAEYCVRSKQELNFLEKIFIAGAPVYPETLRVLEGVIADAQVFTPYGATEALPTTCVRSADVLENTGIAAQGGEVGMPVGMPVPGVSVQVIERTSGAIATLDQVTPLQPFEIGEIIVAGENVSEEYFKRTEVTWMTKIYDGNTVWHRVGDVGYVDESGFLYYCGRCAHVVEDGNQVYCSVPIERIFNEKKEVARSALVDLGPGRGPGLVVEPYPQYWPEQEEQRALFLSELEEIAANSVLTKNIRNFFFHPSFPVDGRHNAKIFRDELSEWAVEQLGVARAA